MPNIHFRTETQAGVLIAASDITVNGISYGAMPAGTKTVAVPDNGPVGIVIIPAAPGATYVQVINIYDEDITFRVVLAPTGAFGFRLNIIGNPVSGCVDLYAAGNNYPALGIDETFFTYDTIPPSGVVTAATNVWSISNVCPAPGDYNFTFQYYKAGVLLVSSTREQSIPYSALSGSGSTGNLPPCNVLALNCQALLMINGEENPSCATIGQVAEINIYASFPAITPGSGSGSQGCTQLIHVEMENLSTGEQIIDVTYDWDVVGPIAPPQLSLLHTLEEFGNYYLKVTLDNCGETLICEKTWGVCFDISLIKQSCYNYRFYDSTDYTLYLTDTDGIVHTVTVKDTDGTYEQVYTTDITNTEFVDIVLPHDGIYTVTVSNAVTGTVRVYTIYELCALIACWKSLVLNVLCNEDDPCCEDCDPNRKEKLRQDRAELNKLLALYVTLFAFVQKDKINYQGIFAVDDDRELQMEYISGIMDQINHITARCSECESIKTSSKPCKSC